MNKGRTTIHIATRDRWSELALLLQSLRTQTVQDWDLIILDDQSGTPLTACHFLINLFNRIKLEGHKIKILRNPISFGCCYARNKCIDEDDFDNEYTLRLDDDVIIEQKYIEKLKNVIELNNYDMASGVVPLLGQPELKRETRFINNIMNEHQLDKEGNLIMNKDESAYCYIETKVYPTHQFRTNCLYKSKINKKVRYPDNLTTVAFREEGFFSFAAIIAGYTIGINTTAICWHLQTPSGGNRRQDYAECVKIDEQTWREWVKSKFEKHGNFLEKYNKRFIK